MITRRTVLLGLPASVAACISTNVSGSPHTTVIMLRHADRAGEILNSTGIARAAALPNALADFDIDAIYCPDIGRNLETAQPLAQATGLPITVIPKEKAAARMTTEHPDGTVVWIGNKRNLVSIWDALGAPGFAPQEYGEIGIIQLQGSAPPIVTRQMVLP